MKRHYKILLAVILCTMLFTQKKVCKHLGFGQSRHHVIAPDSLSTGKKLPPLDSTLVEDIEEDDYYNKDSLYRWDDQIADWVMASKEYVAPNIITNAEQSQPIKVEWDMLMDIRYKLKYFEDIDMKIFAPVFSKSHKALHGREVIIEGFVIPFKQDEALSLSFNPYASCFFCGKASPASVISMYLRDKSKRYKVDEFKTIRGTLHLNVDDPNEFCYILRDAREE